MRNKLWLIALIIGNSAVYGQRTEISVQAGSGLFSFYGSNAVSETVLSVNGEPFISNPYGRNSGFSYSIAGHVQYVDKNKLVYGIQVGYEQLTSQVAITSTVGDWGPPIAANGRAKLQNQYLNLNPFVGKRFGTAQISLDATIGLDAAIGLSSRESGKLVDVNSPYFMETGRKLPFPDVDLRPRLSLTGYYRDFGLSIGYSYGLSNYAGKRYGTNAEIFSRFWRVGLAYRLGKRA